MDKRTFLRGTCLLTLESAALRLSGIWFRGWVCGALGPVQMGIFQLVFSVFMLGVVLAAAGTNFAATRLTAERGPNRRTLRRCLLLGLGVSSVAAGVLFCCAPMLSPLLGGTLPLRLLLPGLPCIAAAAALKGCFLAQGHTGAPMAAELLEQAAGIALSLLFVRHSADPLAALALAASLGEAASCCFMVLAYRRHFLRRAIEKKQPPAPWREAVRIGAPVLVGTGLRSALFSVENLLIPSGLAVQAGTAGALAQYGLVQGMVLPVLQFPGALLAAAVTLLVPELARCCAAGQKRRIRLVAGQAFRLTLCFSFAAAAGIAAFAVPLCHTFYGSTQGATLLHIMAPLLPLMYVDSVVDGMLKGLDQQNYTLLYNLSDACLRVLWCAFVLPRLGLMGYVLLLFLSEIYNASLSISRLMKVADIEISPGWVLLPAACAVLFYILWP